MAIEIIRDLAAKDIRLRSLTEPFLDIDATTPMGEAIVGIMAVLAQLRVATIAAALGVSRSTVARALDTA